MWAVTGWAVATWLKITVFLALGVGAAWLWCSPGWFAAAIIAFQYRTCSGEASDPSRSR